MLKRSLAIAVLVVARVAVGQPSEVAPPGGDAMRLEKDKVGPSGNVGNFPGTLICTPRADVVEPGGVAECGADKIYVLSLETDAVRLAIVAGNDTVRAALPTLVNQRVVAQGKHYTNTGSLGVAEIAAASTEPKKQTLPQK